MRGLEPPCLATYAPEAYAATNYATCPWSKCSISFLNLQFLIYFCGQGETWSEIILFSSKQNFHDPASTIFSAEKICFRLSNLHVRQSSLSCSSHDKIFSENFVGEGRLELPCLAALAPKASVSAISPLAQI